MFLLADTISLIFDGYWFSYSMFILRINIYYIFLIFSVIIISIISLQSSI